MGDFHELWKTIQRCHLTYTQFPPMVTSDKTIVQYHNQGTVMIQVKILLIFSSFICTHLCVCVCAHTCAYVYLSSMQFIICLSSLIQHHTQARHRKVPLSHDPSCWPFITSLPLHSLSLTHGNKIVCSPFL